MIVQLQDRIEGMLKRNVQLDVIDRQVIQPAELSPEQKAALWLYALTRIRSRRTQRRIAVEVLAAVS